MFFHDLNGSGPWMCIDVICPMASRFSEVLQMNRNHPYGQEFKVINSVSATSSGYKNACSECDNNSQLMHLNTFAVTNANANELEIQRIPMEHSQWKAS